MVCILTGKELYHLRNKKTHKMSKLNLPHQKILTYIEQFYIFISIDTYDGKRMKEQEIAKICKALGDENRVKIIKLLSNGELCACKLLEEFKISQSTLSHHMKILTDCNLVDFKKDGKWVHYSINTKAFSEFKKEIKSLTGKKK